MIIHGFGSTVDELEASIQSKIAEFLACKQRILRLQNASILTVREEAKELYSQQLYLEGELTKTLGSIEAVKTDVYSLSDLISIGTFYYLMLDHVSNVNSLEEKLVAQGGTITPTIDTSKLLMIGGGLVLAYALFSRR